MSRRRGDPRVRRAAVLAALAVVVTLAGCGTTRVDQPKPAVDVPAAWRGAATGGEPLNTARWWAVYGDTLLERLIDEAGAHNADVVLAVARVDEARAIAAGTDAARRPVVDGRLGADRTRSSRRTAMQQPAGTPLESNNLRATAAASYEIDLWDRLSNTSAAARADVLSAEAARDTVRIAVAAEVAQSYFRLRALDAQLAIVERTIALRDRTLELQRQRVAAGVLAELDLRQIEAEIAALRTQRSVVERDRNREEALLAVLLGRSPRAIMSEVIAATPNATATPAPVVVPAGLPSELLLRRPDILAAEHDIAAANARVSVARVAHFPSITLTGFLGLESATLGNLFSGPAGIWQVAAALMQPLYAGGRLEADVEASEARLRQALARYQSTIQAAFRDVRNALANQTQARASYDSEQARITALQEAVRLARLRYEGGIASQLEVLDAERGLLAAEIDRIESLRAQRAAIAELMKALGGGWE